MPLDFQPFFLFHESGRRIRNLAVHTVDIAPDVPDLRQTRGLHLLNRRSLDLF